MEGIIVACDAKQEWLLPWWWDHYSKWNDYPIVFIDFGMTEKGVAFCSEKGSVIPLLPISLIEKPITSPATRALWEEHYSNAIWHSRMIWFKKPFALLQSPFLFSLWLDLDCKVQKSLDPLFNSLLFGSEIAMCREPDFVQEAHKKKGFIQQGETNYNCGVIAFRKDAPILHRWVEEITLHNDRYVFDQQALARALLLEPTSLIELPSEWNWSRSLGENPNALIQHYHGGVLKGLIREELSKLLV